MWKRIIAPAVVVSLFWMIVGLSTSFYLYSQSRSLDVVIEEDVASILAAKGLQEITWRMQSFVAQASSTQAMATQTVVNPAIDETSLPARSLIDLTHDAESLLKTAEISATLPAELELLGRIRTQFTQYASRCLQTMETPGGDPMAVADLRQLATKLAEPCDELVRINQQVIRDASQLRQKRTTWIVVGRTSLLFLGPGLGLWMGFRLARQLNQSITKISVSLQTFAGDLRQEIGEWEIPPQTDLSAIQRQLDAITDRMRGVVQELHQSRQETMRAERLAAVGELAAGVAHELRNPLTSVKLLIQTMQHRHQATIPRETFDVVLEEIGRMESTIQGLLDFARPPVLHRAVQDLCTIVRRAANLAEGKARQNSVTLALHLPDEPVWVNVDAGQLHQVCVNILLNGVESMPTGGVFAVHVAALQDLMIAQVRFEDAGEGIPDSILPRLFEPFVTSKESGTGLGLAVSRRIILNHSGRLVAENRSEGGATVTMELGLEHAPAHKVEAHAHAVAY